MRTAPKRQEMKESIIRSLQLLFLVDETPGPRLWVDDDCVRRCSSFSNAVVATASTSGGGISALYSAKLPALPGAAAVELTASAASPNTQTKHLVIAAAHGRVASLSLRVKFEHSDSVTLAALACIRRGHHNVNSWSGKHHTSSPKRGCPTRYCAAVQARSRSLWGIFPWVISG